MSNVATNRPAETATGLTGAVVAILVATTHLSTSLATALVVVVGALPGLITAIVTATRSTAAGVTLVSLTPKVTALADSALDAGIAQGSPTDKTATLKGVTDAMASWTQVLSAESGTSASAKQTAAGGS